MPGVGCERHMQRHEVTNREQLRQRQHAASGAVIISRSSPRQDVYPERLSSRGDRSADASQADQTERASAQAMYFLARLQTILTRFRPQVKKRDFASTRQEQRESVI